MFQKAYSTLFKQMSYGQSGKLYHALVILRRTDVNGNVKSNYKAHEDLFLLMFKALVHVAAEEIYSHDRDYVFKLILELYCTTICCLSHVFFLDWILSIVYEIAVNHVTVRKLSVQLLLFHIKPITLHKQDTYHMLYTGTRSVTCQSY